MLKKRLRSIYSIFNIMLTTILLLSLVGTAVLLLVSVPGIDAYAATEEEYLQESEARKLLPIQSDETYQWPAGPIISAEGAIVMEAETGAILYAKNINEQLYPASITKLLTAIIAMDECEPDELVTFSKAAVESIDWRNDANLGIAPGNSITMEQCLYGLLTGSANEVAYAIAEHVSGDIESFAKKMNEKAKELGCTHSNFVTPNGIHDENHYTSAYDMALIAKAFFADELLSKMASTVSYKVPQSDTQPRDDMVVYAKSKLHKGKEYAYPGLVGTKTGYTDYARQTLVSCASKNGMKLICVVLKEESPYQYTDTITLFNYGFDNFHTVNTAQNDTTHVIQSLNLFSAGRDIFGNSKPILQMNSDAYIILPKDADFFDTTSDISYENLRDNEIARINYYFNGAYIGSAGIERAVAEKNIFEFGAKSEEEQQDTYDESEVIIIDVRHLIMGLLAVALIVIAIGALFSFLIVQRGQGRGGRRLLKKGYQNFKGHSPDWRGFK